MANAATLTLIADSTGLKSGEQGLDSLARKGAKVEKEITLNTRSIEMAMARLGGVIGGLDTTMKSLEAAVTKSMGRTSQEVAKGARTFDDLRASIDPAFAASKRFSDVQAELAGMVKAGAANQDQANAVLEVARSRYLGVATAAEVAEKAQQESAAAVAKATGDYQSLLSSLDPIYAASKRYETAQTTLQRAVDQGVISQREMNRVLGMAEKSYLQPIPAVTKLGTETSKLSRIVGQVKLAFAGLGTVLSIGVISRAADEWSDLQSVVGAAIKDMDAAPAVMQEINRLARASYSSLSQTAEGFARNIQSLRDLGYNTRGALDYTEALNNALVITATRGQRAASVQDALSRAMAVGKLQADGLETVLANGGRVAEALALQLGTNVSGLRQMATDGKITGEVIAGALTGNLEKLRAEAALMPATMADGMTILGNSFTMFIGVMDKALGSSETVAGALIFLGDNIEMVAGYIAAGAIALTGLYVPAMYSAIMATNIFGVSLVTLKGALIATGIGAFIVLAGTMIGKLLELVRITGSVGEAWTALGDLAAAVWGGIAVSAAAIPPALNAVWSAVKADFATLMAELAGMWGGFISSFSEKMTGPAQLDLGFGYMVDNPLHGMFDGAAKSAGEFEVQMRTSSAAAANAVSENLARVGGITEAAFGPVREKWAALNDIVVETGEAGSGAGTSIGEGGEKAAKGAKAAKDATDKLNDSLDAEAQRWRETLDPMAKYRRESEELAKLTGRLSKDEMAKAQRSLNVALADSLPLVGEFTDTMTEGLLNGFKGTLSSIGGMLKKWLANMIAMAAKNRIIIGMGLGSAGGAGAAMAGMPGAGAAAGGGAGNMLGSLGGLGTLGGSIMTGASGFVSALSGGLAPAMQYTQFMAAGATSGMAGLGAAIGAVALPVAAVVAAFSFFKKSTKELDSGLRLTITGMETLVETFNKTETRRFWGLSKRQNTSYGPADSATQDALSRTVGQLQEGVMKAATALGFGAATFENFSHQITLSTKGMSEDEALRAVQDAIGELGDSFATMVPGLEGLAKDGETATQALNRLSGALTGVNVIMDTLGHTYRAVGLTGADMASKIADAFGGMDAMASATQAYYAGFYSDAERLTVATRQSRKALAELNVAMPKSRDEYRLMVEAQNLTTKRGREVYAALISMSGAMDQILPQVAEFTRAMSRLNDRVLSQIDIVMEGLSNAVKANQDAANNWRKAGTDIRSYLDKLRGTASALFNPRQARDYNRQMYERAIQAARGGDVAAAMRLPELASAYLESAQGIARTREEAGIAQARVAAQLGTVAVRTDTVAVALERVAALQGQQIGVLEIAKAYLATGNGLTVESRQALLAKLAGTDGVVTQANRELIRELGIGTGVTAGGISAIVGRLGNLDVQIARQANAAGTIVAGFNDALTRNPLNASVTLSGAEGLQSAMGVLRSSLEALRVAVVAERRRVETAVDQVTQRPPARPAPAPRPAAPAARTGMAKYTFTPVGNLVRAVGPLGGVRHYSDMRHATQYLTGANFPNFERGGVHKGGFRIVGERGPELEATGPSRIISHSQSRSMLDNSEVVAELRAVRAELAEMQAHARRTAESTRDTFKTLREINSIGVKIDPDQNKVSA